jgi:four helix bundle protein
VQDFRKLTVWQKSHHLTLAVYAATRAFPKDELYGLVSQSRRCAVSIPANIAEGCGRDGGRELARFLHIASGSASELEYHMLLAGDLGYLDSTLRDRLARDIHEVKKMLASLAQKVQPNRN